MSGGWRPHRAREKGRRGILGYLVAPMLDLVFMPLVGVAALNNCRNRGVLKIP
jgi:hypothetical protein